MWLEKHENDKGLDLKHDLVRGFPHGTKVVSPKHISHVCAQQLFEQCTGAPGFWGGQSLISGPCYSHQIMFPGLGKGLPGRRGAFFFVVVFFFYRRHCGHWLYTSFSSDVA